MHGTFSARQAYASVVGTLPGRRGAGGRWHPFHSSLILVIAGDQEQPRSTGARTVSTLFRRREGRKEGSCLPQTLIMHGVLTLKLATHTYCNAKQGWPFVLSILVPLASLVVMKRACARGGTLDGRIEIWPKAFCHLWQDW